jgi:SAM-dependent methyltransferase
MVKKWILEMANALLPGIFFHWIERWVPFFRRKFTPVRFGSLRRMKPISPFFGFDRGVPIDRYYIEKFLCSHSEDIRGHVLEIGDDRYTRKFGGDTVTEIDVLHVVEGTPQATIVADLTRDYHIPSKTFDCIIIPLTLQMIYDVRSALQNLFRILKPGGVLLATSHGITKISREEGVDPWGEYWHFTIQSMQRLFQEFFPASHVKAQVYGNVFAAIASLHGISAEELKQEELNYHDPDYEVIIAVRAVRPEVKSE